KGCFDEVYTKLNEVNSLIGLSLWEMNYRIAVLTAKNEFKVIDELVEKWKSDKISESLYEVIRVCGWKSHSVEASIAIETMVRRSNKEYIEGGALTIAAFYSLMCLQYPIYDDVDLGHSLNWLQKLPLIDLFDSLLNVIIYKITKSSFSDDDLKGYTELIQSIEPYIHLNSISQILESLKDNIKEHKVISIDREVHEYTAGNYNSLLDRLEGDVKDISNLITKVNLIAKSYIYTSRRPKSLPPLLSTIINNLIAIYSLKDSNQAISQLINLSIIYSSLELSNHIMISIMKAAPFYFDEKKKTQVIDKSKFLHTSLTPLACNLDSPPSLYFDET
ncbi:TPA: hypothetical protein LR331_004707, partial [Enterobacter hormaechei]|nr:hypothetical protein [Enterobacter hormaechei]